MNAIFSVMDKIYKFLKKSSLRVKKAQYCCSPNVKLGNHVLIFETTAIEATREASIVIGNNTAIRGRLVTYPGCGQITIGDNCYVGENTQIWSETDITIEDHVLIAHNCSIFDSTTHPIDFMERRDQYSFVISDGFPVKEYKTLKRAPIRICQDVWIGCNVIIHKGVTIGKGAIVSAGSVVRGDIPPMTIVAGNPAIVVKSYNNRKR